jgi:outer membrane immunogenic protein
LLLGHGAPETTWVNRILLDPASNGVNVLGPTFTKKRGFFMKRALATAALALLATSSAFAADLGTRKPSPVPVFAAFNWTGAYVGVDAGYSFGKVNSNVPGAATSANPEPSGFSLGGHAGYRYQLQNNIVLGAEIRAFANFSTKNSKDYAGFPGQLGRAEAQWGGDARLSLGYAIDRLLPYVTGGVAVSDVRGCFHFAGAACLANTSFSDTRLGWTVGAGLAYAFTNNLIARVDYTYSDFGKKNYTTAGLPGGVTRIKLETHAVRAGLSYKF